MSARSLRRGRDVPDLADDFRNGHIGFRSENSRAMHVPSNDAQYKRLGDFEVVRELGRGGMGVVYDRRTRRHALLCDGADRGTFARSGHPTIATTTAGE